MKKVLVTLLAITACASAAFAQGTINAFANTSGTLVTTNNGVNSGSAAANAAKVELFWAPNSTALTSLTNDSSGFLGLGTSWLTANLGSTAGAEAVTTITPVAGRFSQAQAITATGMAAGSTVYLQVRGWTGSAANWAAAVTAAQSDASVLLGWTTYQSSAYRAPWLNATGDPNASPSTTGPFQTGASAFNGLILTPVPEPSTFALAGLGAAALMIFRRKK